MSMKPFWFPSGSSQPTATVARAWPDWATAIATQKQPGEVGVGDTIARIIGPIGGDLYKRWFKTLFGRDCGCATRQESLNSKYPYPEG